MNLYSYFRSSAAFRVRIALNLKGLAYGTKLVNLSTGEHLLGQYRTVNPQGRIPTLVDKEKVYIQSISIIEYLEEAYPKPPLLPTSIEERAWVRAIGNIIACDIHPLNNLAVLNYLTNEFSISEVQKVHWYQHWVSQGFEAVEKMLSETASRGKFCFGEEPGLADICLVPQVFNAKRFDCDLEPYPEIEKIFKRCMEVESFAKAQPSNQPEADSII